MCTENFKKYLHVFSFLKNCKIKFQEEDLSFFKFFNEMERPSCLSKINSYNK